MESIFEEVEVSLMALEESVEAREAHEKQVEERFQLTVYQVTSLEIHQDMEIIANAVETRFSRKNGHRKIFY